MSDPERVALEHIRRVVDSILGETTAPAPSPDTPAAQTIVNQPVLLSVPYIRQLGAGADRFSFDSGAAAGAMLVQAYSGQKPTPDEFFGKAGQTSDASLTLAQITAGLTAYGLASEIRSGLKLGDLALILVTGRPAVLPVKHELLREAGLTGESTSGIHYVVAVGMDVANVYLHDPLRRDDAGRGLAVPSLLLYRAWTQIGLDAASTALERAALIPRLALIRRVRVTASILNIRKGPSTNDEILGQVRLGDVFEIRTQQGDWGQLEPDRWISLKYVADI